MDQETANALYEKGGFLLFLDAPENLEFGIDYNSWNIGPRFKGVKLIPPGLHFIYYSVQDKTSQQHGLRSGFFHHFEAGEILVKQWNPQIEELFDDSELDPEQCNRYRAGKYFDQFMGAYPLIPSDTYNTWLNLSSNLTKDLVERLVPNSGKVSCVTGSSEDKLGEEKDEDGLEFTLIDLKKSFPEGASGDQRTKYSLDKSYLLETLLKNTYKSDVLTTQMKECPKDFFIDVISENNFLVPTLKVLIRNINETKCVDTSVISTLHEFQSFVSRKFEWYLAIDEEEEEELGEDAPVVVEL
ncbi:AAR2-domain-containing protein [Basidiobolus meristosporus CBS 931.73]|uniref:AAR2-domain-containing protein n=1 Tax=Basidiobolus meristosporus CBS 931.73 TaxID=1314790 RepID=A0A1Y1Z8Y9_9FUNG|nr:AAR2-domain-containing protein [Basidiobolus meristosporus CBS 931.73]|eukprot:ORY06742.1 AAR2-domain-containing protein [Basidiobolus meristosporus CBS 931.73]